jgi:hypothetical protein
MARFDPDRFPDRLDVETLARQLRRHELARLARAARERALALTDYVVRASTPISRDTRIGTSGR